MRVKININLIIVILLIVFVVTIIALWFMVGKIRHEISTTQTIKHDAITLVIQEREVKKFKENYKEYMPHLKRIENLFVDVRNPVELVEFLEEAAQEAGIESSIAVAPSPRGNFMYFRIFASDDFLKVMHFLTLIENGQYLVEVHELTIRGSSHSQNVDANFLISAPQRNFSIIK